MTWVFIPVCHCSPVRAAWILRRDGQAYELSPTASSIDTPKGSLCQGCGKEPLTQPPSSPMSEPSTATLGAERWISSLEGSPVRMCPTPENAQGWGKAPVQGFGLSSPESFARLDQDGSWLKMSQGYSQLTLDGVSEQFCETWPRLGTMRSGECFPLPTPARPIGGNESGSRLTGKESHHVPTPTAQDGISRKSTSSEVLNFDTNKSVSLDRWVGMWPTPNSLDWKDTGDPSLANIAARESARPTPRTRHLCGGTGSHELLKKRKEDGTISESERLAMSGGGQLNPLWVEWLMGWPIGWTALGAAATEWFRNKPSPRSGGS